jgi:hypothetical protein
VKMLINDSANIGLLSANWNAPSHWFYRLFLGTTANNAHMLVINVTGMGDALLALRLVSLRTAAGQEQKLFLGLV